MQPEIWIIDDEWESYDLELGVIKKAFPDNRVHFSGKNYKEDAGRYAASADAVICQIDVLMDRSFIEKLGKCKIISVYGVGYDNVDTEAAKEKDIAVTNVPAYCSEDVADYVIGAIYQGNKTLIEYSDHVMEESWGAMAAKSLIHRIEGSVLLIIGFGNIGRKIAQKALAMKMKVMVYDPYVTEKVTSEAGVISVLLEEGLKEADFVSLNIKLTDETQGFMDYEHFCIMKPTACFINASRGGTVNELDLIRAVNENKIRTAYLDVISKEPPESDMEILHTEGIFVTPHISFLTQSSLNELQRTAAENVVRYLNGEPVASIVNR